jgi:dipeptidyl aminopeptidase/acylaminoacyl peptidase
MMPIDRFERQLPMALTALAAPRTPEYLTDILGRTARTRQRPAWASIERWLPMELVTARVPTTRMPWRRIVVFGLLVVLLATMVAAFVGSRPRLPAPYGRAANGQIAYDAEGDIYSLDPMTGQTAALVTGPAFDARPIFSRDGTRFAFARMDGGRDALLFVANADGTNMIQVTPEPLDEFGPYHDAWSFSPDGRTILATALVENTFSMLLIPTDGSGAIRTIDVGMSVEAPSFRPPNGSEILFVGHRAEDGVTGLFAVDQTTSVVRTIVEPTTGVGVGSWSPDGSRILYESMDAKDVWRTHVISADGTGEVRVYHHPDALSDGQAVWSNDGTRLVITGVFAPDGSDHRAAVIPVDGNRPGVDIQCPNVRSDALGDLCGRWVWAPDDASIFGVYFDAKGRAAQRLSVDPITGETVAVPWPGDNGQPAWQRLAP